MSNIDPKDMKVFIGGNEIRPLDKHSFEFDAAPTIDQLRADLRIAGDQLNMACGHPPGQLPPRFNRLSAALDELEAWRARG